jgi:hypothetical protein
MTAGFVVHILGNRPLCPYLQTLWLLGLLTVAVGLSALCRCRPVALIVFMC